MKKQFGPLVLEQDGADFSISIDAQAALGGGEAAGVIEAEGKGSIKLKGKLAFDLGMALLEAHSPAALVPLEKAAQAAADAVIPSA